MNVGWYENKNKKNQLQHEIRIMPVLMSEKDAKRVVPPCNTIALNVVQNIYTYFLGLVDLRFILSENRCIFFQMVLWYSLMGDRNNW